MPYFEGLFIESEFIFADLQVSPSVFGLIPFFLLRLIVGWFLSKQTAYVVQTESGVTFAHSS